MYYRTFQELLNLLGSFMKKNHYKIIKAKKRKQRKVINATER